MLNLGTAASQMPLQKQKVAGMFRKKKQPLMPEQNLQGNNQPKMLSQKPSNKSHWLSRAVGKNRKK